MIAPTAIINGLGQTVGMVPLPCPGATGDYHSNYGAKASTALRALYGASSTGQASSGGGDSSSSSSSVGGSSSSCAYDFCFLHIKGVDDAGHDKNVPLKIAQLEKVDDMLGQLIQGVKATKADRRASTSPGAATSDCVIVLTGDHTTPVLSGDHSYETVPFSMCFVEDLESQEPCEEQQPTIVHWDTVSQFDEVSVAIHGALGRFPGLEVLPMIRKFAGWIDK
jgi:2,3-bisphosphoglycerate-independent phosphoglycerate mutase